MDNPQNMPLVCAPFAGAGPSFYHAWSRLEVSGLTICPVQLPGRERKIAEAPYTNLHEAADKLVPEIIKATGGQPFALFGHCFMGSVLAYELAVRLHEHTPGIVKHLFISASRTPLVHKPQSSENFSDAAFLDMVKATTGYLHPAFDIPEMRQLLLPTLRADFKMDETYKPNEIKPLPVPITGIFASKDKLATKEQVSEWKSYTSSTFQLLEFEGLHMYLVEQALPLVRMISETLSNYNK